MRRLLIAAALTLSALVAAGCPSEGEVRTSIADIRDDPARFAEQTVLLDGEVVDAMGAFSAGVYELRDETGSLHVWTLSGLPSKGSKLRVSGRVMSGLTFGGTHYGVGLREGERIYLDGEPPPPPE